MKIAIIGTGKTGGELLKLIPEQNIIGPFTSKNPVTAEKLEEADVVIAFVPGTSVTDLAPVLLDSGKTVLWGATGFNWSEKLQSQCIDQKTKWVVSSNFSLGMAMVRHCINTLSKANDFFNKTSYQVHEVHHVHKKDAPSGTAKSWQEWLGQEAKMTYDREGDVIGVHELTVQGDFEKITLRHESQDRTLFAQGALWAANKINEGAELGFGITKFEDFVDQNFLRG